MVKISLFNMVTLSFEYHQRKMQDEEKARYARIGEALAKEDLNGARELVSSELDRLDSKYWDLSLAKDEEKAIIEECKRDHNERGVIFHKAMRKGFSSQIKRLDLVIKPLISTKLCIDRALAA
jgi:hypothetical protein